LANGTELSRAAEGGVGSSEMSGCPFRKGSQGSAAKRFSDQNSRHKISYLFPEE